MQRASVVLPLPDSPTMPSVRWRSTDSETSSTAVSVGGGLRHEPARHGSPELEALDEVRHLEQVGHVALSANGQAVRWASPTSSGSIVTSAQASRAAGQRGRNGQPAGSCARSGVWPLIW